MNIPDRVTDIGRSAFYGCDSLREITLPDNLMEICNSTFSACRNLTKVNIPDNVTKIGLAAFSTCEKLTKIDIPDDVTEIGNGAFSWCTNLTSITIPNKVKVISYRLFYTDFYLDEVTIGSSVTDIEEGAFHWCSLSTLYSLNTTPPRVNPEDNFTDKQYENTVVYVPREALAAYQTADVWKNFKNLRIIGGTGNEATKCATPTIHYANNKLTFKCKTEGVAYESTITDADITSYNSNEIELGVTYNISVYATKTGFENSDVATATLCWIDGDPKTEGIADDNTTAASQVRANAVLIQSANGQTTVTGLDDGTPVTVYTIDGQQVGSAVSTGGQANVNTNLSAGTIAIVKIGDRSIKVTTK